MTLRFHPDLALYQVVESRLASVVAPGPMATNSADWVAWHFTRIAFLPKIVADGCLLSDRTAGQSVVVGNAGIKGRRLVTPVNLPTHPSGMVGDYVPFYFTPRSPTSYKVLRSTCTALDLVFLGVHVRSIAELTTWCATDGNAVEAITEYTCDQHDIGTHVDLDLLCAQSWPDKTGQDLDRTRRRHAELLVHQQVPLELIAYVVCYAPTQLQAVRSILGSVGGMRKYGVDQYMFMTP